MEHLNVLRNWRLVALTVMAVAAFVLIIGESDSVIMAAITKILGFSLGSFCFMIWRDWNGKDRTGNTVL